MDRLAPPMGLTAHQSALWKIAVASLERFYLPQAGIMARKAVWEGGKWLVPDEPSPRNTAEVLRALYQLRHHGFSHPLDPDPLMDRVVSQYLPTLAYADVALVLWADATGGGRHLPILWGRLCERLPRGATDTMELSWTLNSLCSYLAVAESFKPVETLAKQIYRSIVRNQSKTTGLFHGSGKRSGWLRRRSRTASLPVQTCTIHALASYGTIFSVPEAIERAKSCADALCLLQGPLGQWWWLYDVSRGEVAEPYPVYGVNQDAAIPLALGELQAALGDAPYRTNIEAGLEWLFGRNELRSSLVDEQKGAIWRALDGRTTPPTIVREVYSYHPARCLHALCALLGD